MVPGTTVTERVLASVKLRAAGLADRHADVGAVEGKTFTGEFVQIWGAGIAAAVNRQVIIGAVVGKDDQEIGPRSSLERQSGQQQYNEQRARWKSERIS